MSIPAWLTTTAADVQKDSKITPELWLKAATDTTLQADITRYSDDWSNVVISRLRRVAIQSGLSTSFDDDLSTVLNTEQQKTACQALKLLVISALWQNLPGQDANYFNEANNTGLNSGASPSVDRRLTSGEGLLSELEKDIKMMAAMQDIAGVTAVVSAVSVRPRREDEYSCHPVDCGTRVRRIYGRRC